MHPKAPEAYRQQHGCVIGGDFDSSDFLAIGGFKTAHHRLGVTHVCHEHAVDRNERDYGARAIALRFQRVIKAISATDQCLTLKSRTKHDYVSNASTVPRQNPHLDLAASTPRHLYP